MVAKRMHFAVEEFGQGTTTDYSGYSLTEKTHRYMKLSRYGLRRLHMGH